MLKTLPLATLFVCASFSPILFAAQSAEQTPEDLPEMVVTATRSEIDKQSLSTAATVYTRADIERLQAKSIPDLLRGSTGVDITQTGGYGQLSNVFMRGTNSNHVLVLIDGIKVGSVTAGLTQFEFLPIDQIERVEIIRGPQSSLYGSEAIGGVIQIFTRKAKNATQTPKVTLDAGGGSYYTSKTAGTVSGKMDNSWYNIGASHFDTAGFNAKQPDSSQYGVNQPDKDGFQNTGVNGRAGHHFNNNADIEAFFIHSEGTTHFDGSFQDKTNFINQTVGTEGSIDIMQHWRSTLRLGQTLDQTDSFTPITHKLASRFDTTRWNASWLNQFHLSDNHQFTTGADYRFDEIDSVTQFVKSSRYDVGVFGELHSRLFDNHLINASMRFDNNESFGNYVTGSAGWRYNWDYGISLLANFGNAFKAPTFNDLYYPFGMGNLNLKPEESTSFESGLVGNHAWGNWELRAYHTSIDNLIAWKPMPTRDDPWAGMVENVNKAQIDGIEAEIGTQIMGWQGKLTGNLLNPQDRKTNHRLARRADKTLAFDLSRSFDKIDVGGAILAQGYRFDDAGNQTRVGGYATVDLRSAYHFNQNWMLSAKLGNLLDKNYHTVNGYNTADRNFFLSIHYTN